MSLEKNDNFNRIIEILIENCTHKTTSIYTTYLKAYYASVTK